MVGNEGNRGKTSRCNSILKARKSQSTTEANVELLCKGGGKNKNHRAIQTGGKKKQNASMHLRCVKP